MTEKEWLAGKQPRRMLDFVRGKSSDRKLRLFVCGDFRTFWQHLAIDEQSQAALETSERFADGLATAEELKAAKEKARAAARMGNEAALFAANAAASDATWAVGRLFGHITTHADRRNKVQLLRDLWGPLPFRHLAIEPSWLKAKVIKLAQSIYDDQVFDRLPALADALEDAGCHDADVLGHCRGPGPHIRGCWVLDLILGKA
jgi:hypothetical protein